MNAKGKRFGLAVATLGLALGITFSNTASAVAFNGNYTYLGSFNPNLFQQDTVSRVALTNGAFDDWWVFDINPTGQVSINLTFLPFSPDRIDDFVLNLYEVSAGTCTSVGTACTSINTTPGAIATSITFPDPNDFSTNLAYTLLNQGRYAFNATGNVSGLLTGQSGSYAGNIGTQPVPEPTTLALLGTGLLFSSRLAKRRNKKSATTSE